MLLSLLYSNFTHYRNRFTTPGDYEGFFYRWDGEKIMHHGLNINVLQFGKLAFAVSILGHCTSVSYPRNFTFFRAMASPRYFDSISGLWMISTWVPYRTSSQFSATQEQDPHVDFTVSKLVMAVLRHFSYVFYCKTCIFWTLWRLYPFTWAKILHNQSSADSGGEQQSRITFRVNLLPRFLLEIQPRNLFVNPDLLQSCGQLRQPYIPSES